jgi:hypothetical protein
MLHSRGDSCGGRGCGVPATGSAAQDYIGLHGGDANLLAESMKHTPIKLSTCRYRP